MPKKGRRRRKTRTHLNPITGRAHDEEGDANGNTSRVPRTFVLRHPVSGTGKEVAQLVADLRAMMQPNAALRLKERKHAALKDYVSVAGPLGVTNMLLFSRSARGTNMRLATVPRGPTLSFRVKSFSLSRAIAARQRRPVDVSRLLRFAPLVVLHNFPESAGSSSGSSGSSSHSVGAKPHLTLAATSFQSMFPPIDVTTVSLAECKRVVLVHLRGKPKSAEVHNNSNGDVEDRSSQGAGGGREEEEGEGDGTELIEVRHYAVRVRSTGGSRSVRRLLRSRRGGAVDIGDLESFILGESTTTGSTSRDGMGYASDSDAEDDPSAHVTVDAPRSRRGRKREQQSTVKLTEIGPRITLEIFKVESGLCEGDVLYHRYVQKTQEEARALRDKADARRALKKERRETQERNVERKRKAVEDKREAKRQRRAERKAAAAMAAENAVSGAVQAAVAARKKGQESESESEGDEDEDDNDESSGGESEDSTRSDSEASEDDKHSSSGSEEDGS